MTHDTEQRARIARLLCNDAGSRLIASQEDAPSFDDSNANVQDYWLALADAMLAFSEHPAMGGEGHIAAYRKGFREARYVFDPSVDIRESTPEEEDHVRAFATLTPIPDGAGEAIRPWQPVASAPYACCVQACRFDEASGVWIYAIVNSPPPRPFVWWKMLDAPPADPWPALPHCEKGEGK